MTNKEYNFLDKYNGNYISFDFYYNIYKKNNKFHIEYLDKTTGHKELIGTGDTLEDIVKVYDNVYETLQELKKLDN